MTRPVVTVAAEHGGGGDLVAPRVAEALGLPFLDRAVPASLVGTAEDAERPSGLVASFVVMAGEPFERVDLDEGHVRTELAEFLARTSTDGGVVVLSDVPAVLHVLLSGPFEGRVARVAEWAGVDRDQAERRVRTHDGARQAYLRHGFGITIHDRWLYHLVVDTIALGIDASVEHV
jgi:hypothetical protein